MVKPMAQTLVRWTKRIGLRPRELGLTGPVRNEGLDSQWFQQHSDAKVE